jgi:uncharacterized lipoprotein YddW (UPF0748 family)
MPKKNRQMTKTGTINNYNDMNIMNIENIKGCGQRCFAPFCYIIILGIFLSAVFISADVRAEPEVSGLWVVRDTITSPEKVAGVVDFAVEYGYNTLFVQVRGRGDAFYKSYFVPGPETYPHIPGSFDPLGAIIELAHARGIEVHAWFNMYFTWSADQPPSSRQHLLNSHPAWFMVSVHGKSMADDSIDAVRNNLIEGRYISPALEEVRSYLSKVITEVLVSYDIDGVHLDYVRYPGWKYDFNRRITQRFVNMTGVDPVRIMLDGAAVDPTIEYLEKWTDYKSEQIDLQIKSIARRISLADKEKKIRFSAAVKPNAEEAYVEFGQNWVGWLNEGIMDFVVTMSYHPDTDWVRDVLSGSLKKVDRKKVIGGIGAYKLKPEETAKQIELMNNLGLLGYCMFSYTTFNENPGFAETLKKIHPLNNHRPDKTNSD